MGTPIAPGNPPPLQVFYADLGGGRNTRRDAHALKRNELAVSINGWIPAANSFGKRPGNSSLIQSSATGSTLPAIGMTSVRLNDVTNVIVQSGSNMYAARNNNPGTSDKTFTEFVTNANPAARVLNAATLFDPTIGADAAFIVNGLDAPREWKGIGNAPTTPTVPLNHAGTAGITPAFVRTLYNSLWYAGEPTEPTGVYISDPTAPQSFTYGGALPGAAYLPYLIGYNDGVAGGKITGIMPIGTSMMIYKESAIYRMDHIGYYGDIGPYDVVTISTSTGCVSPKSLVNFDTYHAFLGMDGVYTCDGQNLSSRPISDNNPDLFEGPYAAIVDRTTAVGVRYGSRYLIFFDNGGV